MSKTACRLNLTTRIQVRKIIKKYLPDKTIYAEYARIKVVYGGRDREQIAQEIEKDIKELVLIGDVYVKYIMRPTEKQLKKNAGSWRPSAYITFYFKDFK